VRCSLIIATKGRREPLSALLESAGGGLPADGEVIVVDGDPERSAETVVSALGARFPALTMKYIASDPGAALQRNVGIDAASGDIVVFLDDDCTFEPGLFEALLTAYEDPEVVGVTGWIEQPPRERVAENPHSRLRWLLRRAADRLQPGRGRRLLLPCIASWTDAV
jgi:glycosyltransferase involved in cell wall biosynthesis